MHLRYMQRLDSYIDSLFGKIPTGPKSDDYREGFIEGFKQRDIAKHTIGEVSILGYKLHELMQIIGEHEAKKYEHRNSPS